MALTPVGCTDDPTAPGTGGDPTDHGDGSSYRHDRAPGASAADFLSGQSFQHLVVQVQHVEGFRPEEEALAHLETFLNARLNKPAGIEIRIDEPLPIAPRAEYADSTVRALEARHRTLYTSGDTLVAYLLFLDGAYEQENVLGIAYNNTSAAIFAEKIAENTGGVGQPAEALVQGIVANHEIGHLLGLVNNGSDMTAPHQDVGNGHHCTDESCLMFYAVRTTDFLQNLLGGDAPTLDQGCLDDLRANGGK